MNSKKLIAFTLIELLVVIAIVGILSGFVLVSLNSATDSANDARRKSDLSQIVKALLVYNTSNPTYPIETCSIGSTCSATVNNALGQASGITGPNNTLHLFFN
ncbi:MAG: prepilin-type N-terminal cleavage/methylation domain-containing protein [Candidatus Paceibacterota bacterium]